MTARGRLLAAGRDCAVYEHGPGQVLRTARDGRSLEGEAAVMDHVRSFGFPAPAPRGVTEDGSLLMDRVEGPTLLEAMTRRPWALRGWAATLAGLHQRLHLIPAPAGLRRVGDGGSRVVHLDLHPLNVLMSPDGPVVIDWTNAAAGLPATDVADTWVVLASAAIPETGLKRRLLSTVRARFIASFLSHFDAEEVTSALPLAATGRLFDRNLSDDERMAVRALVEREAGVRLG